MCVNQSESVHTEVHNELATASFPPQRPVLVSKGEGEKGDDAGSDGDVRCLFLFGYNPTSL